MKRRALLLALSVLVFFFSSCTYVSWDEKIQIIATNFPAYDLSRAAAGDAANVRMLLPTGAENHSYEPSARDIVDILNCDLFVYVGGESDKWVEDILSSVSATVRTIRLVDLAEDLQVHSHSGEEKYDEHVWTSPRNAINICKKIAETLSDIDPNGKASYEASSSDYIEKLEALDADFKAFFDSVPEKVLVFGDRFPFAHFANEYQVECYSAFPGCAEETEPGISDVADIIDIVKEKNISTVFYIEFSNQNTAKAIAEATGADTALLHSAHNVSKEEFDAGVTYLSIMRQNLETLKGSFR